MINLFAEYLEDVYINLDLTFGGIVILLSPITLNENSLLKEADLSLHCACFCAF